MKAMTISIQSKIDRLAELGYTDFSVTIPFKLGKSPARKIKYTTPKGDEKTLMITAKGRVIR